MVVYSITTLPRINLVLLVALLTLMFIFVFVLLSLTVLLKQTFGAWNLRSFARRLAFIGAPLPGALLVLLFVVDAELMIRSNEGLVKKGGSQWTFGQTFAMLMVVLRSRSKGSAGIVETTRRRRLLLTIWRPSHRGKFWIHWNHRR